MMIDAGCSDASGNSAKLQAQLNPLKNSIDLNFGLFWFNVPRRMCGEAHDPRSRPVHWAEAKSCKAHVQAGYRGNPRS